MYECFQNFGFSFTENTAAHVLEDTLGIKFCEIPAKVQLDTYNCIIMILHAVFNPAFRDYLANLSSAGLYYPKSNIYVVRNYNLVTDYHENFHGLAMQQNSSLISWQDELNRRILSWKFANKPSTQLFIKSFLYKFTDEGLAEYAAFLSANRKGADLIERTYSQIRFQKYFSEAPNKAPFNTDSKIYQTILNNLEQKLVDYESCNHSILVRNNTVEMFKKQLPLSYPLGFIYTQDFIQHALTFGLELSTAFSLLIQNIPTSFDDLRSPKQFLAKIS